MVCSFLLSVQSNSSEFNKKEIQYLEGVTAIQELANSQYVEIQKNALLCLKSLSTYCKALIRLNLLLYW